MSERQLRNLVLQAASRLGARLFRVNTGLAWAGKVTHVAPGRVLIDDAYPIRMGMTTGGSDLAGWLPTVITADMAGKTFGRFVGIELKTGRTGLTADQKNFLDVVQKAGGLAGVARTVAEAEAIIRGETVPANIPPVRKRGTTSARRETVE